MVTTSPQRIALFAWLLLMSSLVALVDPAGPRAALASAAPASTDAPDRAGLAPANGAAGASVSGVVFEDADSDGMLDAGEGGLGGVKVLLRSAGADGTLGSGDDVFSSQWTPPDGSFAFPGLDAGDFKLSVKASTVPAGLDSTTGNNPSVFTLATDENRLVDFGFGSGASVSGVVFEDADADGRVDPGDEGLAAVKVVLRSAGDDEVLGTGDDAFASVWTVADGTYRFGGLAAGDFKVSVDASTVPPGMTLTTGNNPLVLALSESQQMEVDFGYVDPSLATVGNRIWEDENANGLRERTEPPLSGVEVSLFAEGSPAPTAVVTTNRNGVYRFIGVDPGVYTVQVAAPAGMVFTLQQVNGKPERDSDADGSGLLGPLTLDPGEIDYSWDAGLVTGPPLLEALDVTGSGVSINPAFAPLTSRFAVYPDATTEGVVVTATTAHATDSLTIDGQPVNSGEGFPIADPQPGDEIAVEVSSPVTGTRRYELKYLPVDFPIIEVTTLEPGVTPGVLYLNSRSSAFYSLTLDNGGVPEFIRALPERGSTFTKHPNGQRSYSERIVTGSGLPSTERVILDENFQEVERVQVVPPLAHTDGHDFLILPNGNHVFLSYEPTEHDGVTYEDAVIQEVDTSGNEVFRWSSWGVIPLSDQLRPDDTDYAHINSVFLDDDGNFLASLRGVSQIVKINRTTGDLMWKLGGLSNEFTINDPLGGPCGQHHVTRLPNGNILFFDNGIYCPDLPEYPERGESSRAVEYALDEVNKVATLVWSYAQEGTYGASGGSAQRFENGNTLVGWGGRTTGPAATEVDPEGNVVFELFIFTGGNPRGSNRILRFSD